MKIGSLEPLLSDKTSEVKKKATIRLLPQLGETAISSLTPIMNVKDGEMRKLISESLARLSPESIPVLMGELQAGDWNKMWCAATALSLIGKDAVSDLITVLRDNADPQVRWAVVDTLGAIGLDAKEAIPQLEIAVDDADPDVSESALHSLRQIKKE